MNKALDYNKLKQAHAKGKLLKKQLTFPLMASIKFDGHYSTVIKREGKVRFISSGGHEYTNNQPTVFDDAMPGVYLCERIATDGKLGDRRRCSLVGTRGRQVALNHTYKIHDYLTPGGYEKGKSLSSFDRRYQNLLGNMNYSHAVVRNQWVHNEEELEAYLKEVTDQGYEGIMLKQPDWVWKRTTSRTPPLTKYKRRPTADLLVVGYEEGEGKYEGMIGALICIDFKGREVSVGSGMSDWDREQDESYFYGKVVEVFYEQIMNTYIQPTFGSEYEGVLIRTDKTKEDID